MVHGGSGGVGGNAVVALSSSHCSSGAVGTQVIASLTAATAAGQAGRPSVREANSDLSCSRSAPNCAAHISRIPTSTGARPRCESQ